MRISADSASPAIRPLLAGIWGLMCAMILAAPILLSFKCIKAGTMFYLCFSGFCHQIADRSFSITGYPLAVCHRCFGMYLGLFLGSLIDIPFTYWPPQSRRRCILAASALMLLDVLLPCVGLWQNTHATRFTTGLVLGYLISPLLAQGTAELVYAAPGRKPAIRVFK